MSGNNTIKSKSRAELIIDFNNSYKKMKEIAGKLDYEKYDSLIDCFREFDRIISDGVTLKIDLDLLKQELTRMEGYSYQYKRLGNAKEIVGLTIFSDRINIINESIDAKYPRNELL